MNALAAWVSASLSFKGGITLSDGFYNVPEGLGHHRLAGTHSYGDALPAQRLLSAPGLWLLDPRALAPDMRRAAAPASQTRMRAGAMQAGIGARPSPSDQTNKHLLMYIAHVLSLTVILYRFE